MSTHTDPPNRRIERRSRILTTPLVLALVGVIVIVAGGVVWAVFARAPESVQGRGIIMPRGNTVVVTAPTTGVVKSVLASPSGSLRANQPILQIRRADGTTMAVRTRLSGALVEVRAAPGSTVTMGEPIAIVTTDREPGVAVAFIPAGPGASVAPGMTALVSPSNLPPAQYGAIEGVVTSVTPVPVSSARITALFLGNDSLVRYFTEEGPALEVRVRLAREADTPSGFSWTVGDGPTDRVSAGTLAMVSVITDDASIADNLVR